MGQMQKKKQKRATETHKHQNRGLWYSLSNQYSGHQPVPTLVRMMSAFLIWMKLPDSKQAMMA